MNVEIKRKVLHVRAAKQTREHTCHWPGCTQLVPPAKWGCVKHWYMLPSKLRSAIWKAYVPGQEITMTPTTEYVKVAKQVQEYILAKEKR